MSVTNQEIERLLLEQTPGEVEPPAGMRGAILSAVDDAEIAGGLESAGFDGPGLRLPKWVAGVGLAAAAMVVVSIGVWGGLGGGAIEADNESGFAFRLPQGLQPRTLVMSNPLAEEGRRLWNEVRAFGDLVGEPARRLVKEASRL